MNRLEYDGKKKARKPPAVWPRRVSTALSVTFLLAVAVLIWASERGVVNLLAASLALASWFLLSRLRK